jgi:large subunit ribosomal protein L22
LIRGRNVSQALAILKFTNKRAAQPIAKCLNSAIANATYIAEQQNIAIDPDDLWVKTCFVDMGPHKNRRRMRPAPQGRAYREQRHYCHITIEVSSEEQPKTEVQKNLGGKEADSSAGDKKAKGGAKSSKKTEKKAAEKEVKETKAEEAAETVEPKESKKAKKQKVEETEEAATDTPAAASEPTSPEPDVAAEQEAKNEADAADAKDATSQTPAEKNETKPADDKQEDINEELERQ